METVQETLVEVDLYESVEVYEVEIVGIRPLLMNAPNLEQLQIASKRRSEVPDPRKEAEMKLYKSPDGKICVPAYVVKACIRSAGRNYKLQGRKSTYASMIRAGIDIEPEWIPIVPDKWVVDIRPVVVNRGSRVLRARPRFDEWSLKFRIINKDPSIIRFDVLRKILIDAGRFYGLCDYRPDFGLFKVVKFEQLQKD
jgi:hypothetical protein